MHKKLFAELKAIKTVLEVPKFRDSLPKQNLTGSNFNSFTKELGKIYKETVTHLVDKAGVPVEGVLTDEELLALSNVKKKKAAEKKGSITVSPSKRRMAQKGSEFTISMRNTFDRKQSNDIRMTQATSIGPNTSRQESYAQPQFLPGQSRFVIQRNQSITSNDTH